MNTIPGAQALGYGFNVLGSYDESSLTIQILVHQSQDAGEYTYEPTGITYRVPDNTSVHDETHVQGVTETCSDQQEFQSSVAAKAGIEGSYGGFKGEFDLAYRDVASSSSAHYYGAHSECYSAWRLTLDEYSPEFVDKTFQAAVLALPVPFTRDAQDAYFAVFHTYGTHFVTQVLVGGRLDYFVAVEKSYTSDVATVSANITLEYRAVFSDTDAATAKADWDSLDANNEWTERRTVSVSAWGGDTGPLNALTPTKGDWEHDVAAEWSQAVMQNPAPINFGLAPLSALFATDAARAAALDAATTTYMNGAIVARTTASYQGGDNDNYLTTTEVTVAGNPVPPDNHVPLTPPAGWTYDPCGIQLVLLDPLSLKVVHNSVFPLDAAFGPETAEIYDAIEADVKLVPEGTYLLVFVASGIQSWNYPSPYVANWLEGYGAALTAWRAHIGQSTGLAVGCGYLCLGRTGDVSGSAIERYGAWGEWDLTAVRLAYAG